MAAQMLERIPALVEMAIIQPKPSSAPYPFVMTPAPASAVPASGVQPDLQLHAPTPRSRANSRHVHSDDAATHAPEAIVAAAAWLRRDAPLADFASGMQDTERYVRSVRSGIERGLSYGDGRGQQRAWARKGPAACMGSKGASSTHGLERGQQHAWARKGPATRMGSKGASSTHGLATTDFSNYLICVFLQRPCVPQGLGTSDTTGGHWPRDCVVAPPKRPR